LRQQIVDIRADRLKVVARLSLWSTIEEAIEYLKDPNNNADNELQEKLDEDKEKYVKKYGAVDFNLPISTERKKN